MGKLVEELCPGIHENPIFKAGQREGHLEGMKAGMKYMQEIMDEDPKEIKEKQPCTSQT